MNLMRLGDMSYSHLKVDDDIKNDKVNEPLLQDLQRAGELVDVVLTITTAKSDHDPYVKGTKRKSRHMAQVAVDIAKLDGKGSGGATNGSNGRAEFREKGNKVKDALVAMGYTWNTESGNPKAVLWHTNTGGNHYNHLHVSNKTGQSSDIDISDLEDEIGNQQKKSPQKNNDVEDTFAKMSQKEKDKFVGDLLQALSTEGLENQKSLIEEALRIKELMK